MALERTMEGRENRYRDPSISCSYQDIDKVM